MNKLIAIIREPEHSENLVRYVINMALDMEADVRLVYIQTQLNYPLGTPGLTGGASAQVYNSLSELAKEGEKELSKMVRDIKKEISEQVAVSIDREIENAKSVIEKQLAKDKKTMLVIENNLSEGTWSIDTTNMELVRDLDCPVWILPSDAVYHPFDEILYATDYNEEDFSTLKKLIGLTGNFSPNITALHITENIDFEARIKKSGFNEMLREKTNYDKIFLKTVNDIAKLDLGLLVNNYASLLKVKLIVVLKENRHFFERIFKADSTKKIVQQADIPVLVFHQNN